MKGVYENEEVHLPRKLTVPSKPELVSISMNSERSVNSFLFNSKVSSRCFYLTLYKLV